MAVTKKIFLVPGHAIGGDPGAVYGPYKESEETVQITERTAAILRGYGLDVRVDPHHHDMYDSVSWVNSQSSRLDDGIVIDIHKNSHTSAATGVETWIMRNSDDETHALANAVQASLVAKTGLRNRGIKEENWYVITNANCRGVLVECGFINNDPNTDEYDEKYARGIAEGILGFFGIPVTAPAPAPAPVAYFRVYVDGKQVGAYTVEKNAYNKWVDTGRVGVIKNSSGTDVTEALRLKYEPVVEPTKPDYGEENNTLLKQILALLTSLVEKISKIFK